MQAFAHTRVFQGSLHFRYYMGCFFSCFLILLTVEFSNMAVSPLNCQPFCLLTLHELAVYMWMQGCMLACVCVGVYLVISVPLCSFFKQTFKFLQQSFQHASKQLRLKIWPLNVSLFNVIGTFLDTQGHDKIHKKMFIKSTLIKGDNFTEQKTICYSLTLLISNRLNKYIYMIILM